ncbi:MAG TPA: carbohydrate kinase family protein [Bacteroidota bacterium]|nr:carbohydrate kinase family protein [Bacteroidota bacterium]
MKYTVIGHFAADIRQYEDGSEHRTYGGILTTVCALASLAGPQDAVYPVFGVGERDYYGVKTALAAYPNVDIAGIYSYPGESNEVRYTLKDGMWTGRGKRNSDPIPFQRIEPFLNVNGVLINMMSGFDITIDTLDEIRMAVRPKATPIHLDFHNLSLGFNPDGSRFRRPMSDWRRWCFMINSVQMNDEEAAGLTFEYTEIDQLVRQIVPLMVQAFCVTHAERGATVYEVGHKSATVHEIAGIPAATASDTIGCGDIFGAAFLFGYCALKNYADAGAFANRAASLCAQTNGDERFSAIAQMKVSE